MICCAAAVLLVLLVSSCAASLCANDCANVTSHVVCFNASAPCGSGKPGQFAFFAFSQISLPAYCDALTRNYDVTARDASRRCPPGTPVSPVLSIHGLWPNYVGGFPQCCTVGVPLSNTSIARSFDPRSDPRLFGQLTTFWIDPASADPPVEVCGQMWNHEHLKHATCMLRPRDPVWFLNMTLALNAFLQPHTAAVERVRAKHVGALIGASELRSLYGRAIQLSCDPSTTTPRLVELRTCWSVSPTTGEPSAQIDCTPDRFECPDHFFM
jgi:ribonuclease T2